MRSLFFAIALGAVCAATTLAACDDITTVNPYDAGAADAASDGPHDGSADATSDASSNDAADAADAESDAHDAADGD